VEDKNQNQTTHIPLSNNSGTQQWFALVVVRGQAFA
jgi:hypothetical protein